MWRRYGGVEKARGEKVRGEKARGVCGEDMGVLRRGEKAGGWG